MVISKPKIISIIAVSSLAIAIVFSALSITNFIDYEKENERELSMIAGGRVYSGNIYFGNSVAFGIAAATLASISTALLVVFHGSYLKYQLVWFIKVIFTNNE